MKNKIDKSHIWGEFTELLVNNKLIVRTIRVFEGSATSIHKHNTEEILIVESGEIIEWLEDENGLIQRNKYHRGDIITVPANKYHRLEYGYGEYKSGNKKFAQVTEIMIGENNEGEYKITRLEEAWRKN